MTPASRRVAILQSSYLPWKGYFDIIHEADIFVFYDDVQYTTGDWRNRNRIKAPAGPAWLSVPVGKGIDRRNCDVEIRDQSWARRHWDRLRQSYEETPGFASLRPFLEDLYLARSWTHLSALNQHIIRHLGHEVFGLPVTFRDSREFTLTGDRQERLIDLLSQLGATEYISGPSAKTYIDPEVFARAGITLHWMDYSGYPEYPQVFPPFRHDVSVLDLLFHTGSRASEFIWGHPARLDGADGRGRTE